MLRRLLVIPLAALAVSSCNDPRLVARAQPFEERHQQALFEPTRVDVLWVIDDSGSMDEEQQLLSQGFAVFAERFLELGLDFHLGVTTTDARPTSEGGRLVGTPPVLTGEQAGVAGAFLERALVGTNGGSREAGFEAASRALSEPLVSGATAGCLRDVAILAVVFVSDEDDQSLPAGSPEPTMSQLGDETWRQENLEPVQAFVDRLLALKDGDREKLFVASIIGDPSGDGCGDAEPGFRSAQGAEALGGFWRSICGDAEAFRAVLEEIAAEVSGPLPVSFRTAHEPIPGTVTVEVDGVPVPDSAWEWVDGEGVVFAPGAAPLSCASVVLRYELPAGVSPPAAPPALAPG